MCAIMPETRLDVSCFSGKTEARGEQPEGEKIGDADAEGRDNADRAERRLRYAKNGGDYAAGRFSGGRSAGQ